MVLTGSNLFEKPGLYNEDGILKERWQQEGSSVVNISGQYEDDTLYTVTAGKTLYIRSMSISTFTGADSCILKDNATQVFRIRMALEGTYPVVFDPPLEFSTSVVSDCNDTMVINLNGWEE